MALKMALLDCRSFGEKCSRVVLNVVILIVVAILARNALE